MPDISTDAAGFTLRQLRTLAAVARHRSITAAARELHLSQPAVSMQLRELEVGWGLALHERIGRGIQLTAAGEELAACAVAVLDQLRATRERLDAMRGLATGVLRLGAVSTAKYLAPSMLAAFNERHPGIGVQFTVGNRGEMIERLAANDSDLVVMGRPPPELETESCAFARHPLVFIAAPEHPLAGRHAIPLAALAGERFLIREPGSGTRAAMESHFAEHGVAWEAAMEMSSNETIKQAVMAGMGLSFISAHTIALEVKTGRLAVLDVADTPVMRAWHILHLASKRLAPVAEAFYEDVSANGARLIDEALGLAGSALAAGRRR